MNAKTYPSTPQSFRRYLQRRRQMILNLDPNNPTDQVALVMAWLDNKETKNANHENER